MRLLSALGIVVVMSACSSPGDGDVTLDTGPDRDFAGRPEVVASGDPLPPPPTLPPAPGDVPAPTTTVAGPDEDPEPGEDGQTGSPARDEADPSFSVLATVDDPAGDAGVRAPVYGDVTGVVVEAARRTVRITVEVAGRVPTRLAEGEVAGIGVDLFRSDSAESDHQLFADGGSDGWFAYLTGPDGLVAYPGDFFIRGRTLVFVVPWAALGSPTAADFSAFADWSKQELPLNPSSQDRAPDRGRASFSR